MSAFYCGETLQANTTSMFNESSRNFECSYSSWVIIEREEPEIIRAFYFVFFKVLVGYYSIFESYD